MGVLALLASLFVGLVGPAPSLSTRDAPRVLASVSYRGSDYAHNVVLRIHARGGQIAPQRGTYCGRLADGGLECPMLPVHSGSSNPISFLATHLQPGTFEVRVTVTSDAGAATALLRRPVHRFVPRR